MYEAALTGNKLGGDLEEVVSLQKQTSPYFQLREKWKCKEYIGKTKFQSKNFSLVFREREVTSPYIFGQAWTLMERNVFYIVTVSQ